MNLDQLSSAFRKRPECIIKVGSSKEMITDLYPFIVEVTIDCSRTEPGRAALKFETRRDENGKWIVQDSGILTPWEPIIIEAAFGNTPEEIMRGYIREIIAKCPQDAGECSVTVKCQDDSVKLDREHIRMTWGQDAPTSDGVILDTILRNHDLSPDPNNESGQDDLVIHQDDTDIKFLRQRAEANGYDLIFRKGSVYFGSMRVDAEAQATIMVYAGTSTNCYNISIKDDGHNPDSVTFDRPNKTEPGNVHETFESDLTLLGKESTLNQGNGLRPFSWRMKQLGGMSEVECKARAQQKANELSMKVKAEGELDGSLYGHVLRPGEPVGVCGIGERYGGIYLVDSVKHLFNLDGYRQTFTLLRNAYGDNLESSDDFLSAVL